MAYRVPISRFGRRLFDFDNFFGNSLDFFDPFDRWDLSLPPSHFQSLNWIRQPPALSERPADKFRVTLPVHGFNSSEITTSIINDRTLKIHAKHVEKGNSEDDYHVKEFSKTFALPANADTANLTSFITSSQTLVVEIPLRTHSSTTTATATSNKSIDIQRNDQSSTVAELVRSTFVPQVVGNQKVEMNVALKNFKPDQIQVTLKDRDLILKAESQTSDAGRTAREYIYRQVTLPPGTDVDKLFSTFENGVLHIEAPFHEDHPAITS